jgi:hypothetical protein
LKYNKTLKHIAVNIPQPLLKKHFAKNLDSKVNDENANPAIGMNRKRKIEDNPKYSNDLCKKQDKLEIPVDNLIKDLILCNEELKNPVEALQESYTFCESNTVKPTEDLSSIHTQSQAGTSSMTQPFDVKMDDLNQFSEMSTTEIEELLNEDHTGLNNFLNTEDEMCGQVTTPVFTTTFDDLLKLDVDEMKTLTSFQSNEIISGPKPTITFHQQEECSSFNDSIQDNSDLYYYQNDESVNRQSYIIKVKCDKKDREERMDYAINTVFKRQGQHEQSIERRGEDNDIIVGKQLCKQDVIKERKFVRLVQMINEIYGSSEIDVDVLSHLKRVIRQANVADLLKCTLSNEAANEHKIRIIDAKKRMRLFKTNFLIKNGDSVKQGKFKYGCVAITQSKDSTENNFGYYHSGGKSAQWLPLPINAAIFKLQDKLQPGKTIVMDSEVYVLCDNELIIIDLFSDDQQTITVAVPDTSNKNLLLARLKHCGNVCILDVVKRQFCIISKGSPLMWTKLKSMNETRMAHTNSIQYTLHTTDYIPEIVTVPAKSKNEKVILCDIFTSNQSQLLECNEYLLSQMPMKKKMTISSVHPGFIQVKMKAFDDTDSTKYILVSAEILNKSINNFLE